MALRRLYDSGFPLLILAAMALSFGVVPTQAQRVGGIVDLPDAPIPKQNPPATAAPKEESPITQTINLLGRRSLVFPDLAYTRGSLNSVQKFELATDKTLVPSRFLGSAFTAAIGQARDSLPGYGQGWSGYGKRFGSSVASTASNNMFGTFLLPSILHQDPRYFVKMYGSPGSRIQYALTRIVITRRDDGRPTFNWSGLVGGMMAEGLANSYLPDGERTAGKTFSRFGIRMGFSALSSVVKEYWPTIFRSLGINKITPDRESDPGTVTPDENPNPPKD